MVPCVLLLLSCSLDASWNVMDVSPEVSVVFEPRSLPEIARGMLQEVSPQALTRPVLNPQ